MPADQVSIRHGPLDLFRFLPSRMCASWARVTIRNFVPAEVLGVFAFLLASVGPGFSESPPSEKVQVGGISVRLPAPKGNIRVDGKDLALDALLKASIPPSNRALAIFASEETLAAMLAGNQSMNDIEYLALVIRSFEYRYCTEENFEIVKAGTRRLSDDIKKGMGPRFEKLERDLSKRILEELDVRAKVKTLEVIPLGVIDESPESISTALLRRRKIKFEGEAEVESFLLINTCILNVRGKLINLVRAEKYVSPKDLELSRDGIKAWRELVLSENKP